MAKLLSISATVSSIPRSARRAIFVFHLWCPRTKTAKCPPCPSIISSSHIGDDHYQPIQRYHLRDYPSLAYSIPQSALRALRVCLIAIIVVKVILHAHVLVLVLAQNQITSQLLCKVVDVNAQSNMENGHSNTNRIQLADSQKVNAHSPVSPNDCVFSKPTTSAVNLYIISANINGLRGKIDRLKVLASIEKPDIIACQETKIGTHTNSESVMIDNYVLFRKDRNDSGGGVALYIKESLKAAPVKTGIEENLELVAAKVKLRGTSFIVASVYKPPRTLTSDFIESFSNFLSSCCENCQLVITGDTNLCALTSEFTPLKEICVSFELNQIINIPTHNGRLIDQIFVSKSLFIHSSGIDSPIEKIHSQTWVKICIELSNKMDKAARNPSWNYKKADWVGMNTKLMEWNILRKMEELSTVNESVSFLQQKVRDAMEYFIPKLSNIRKSKIPWLSKELVTAHKAERKAYRKWRRSNSPAHRSEYKQMTKRLKKETFLAKQKHFMTTFENSKDSSGFWRALNNFTGRKKHQNIPNLSSSAGLEANSDYDKSELLLQQFASVFISSNLSNEAPPQPVDDDAPHISVKQILKKMNAVPSRKSPGIDGITGLVIKRCSIVLAPCLAVICQRCLTEGLFPTEWKKAIIVPVPKVSGSSNPSDYRPISLLPLLSKIAESVINLHLMHIISPFLGDMQFGFRANRSTSDAILNFQHFALNGFRECEEMNRATNVVAVFFDIAKAFDSVPHDQLLSCLEIKYKLTPLWLRLIHSYLTDRTMQVRVGQSLSSNACVKSGVPQGSVLGPTLFIAFFNQVLEVPLNSKSNMILYADDMAYLHPLVDDNSATKIQSDIDLIANQIKSMTLQLNAKKCQFMILGLGNSKKKPQISISVDENNLQQVSIYKYLGVEIDDRLNFAQHVSKTSLKTKKCVGALCSTLRKWASKKVFETAITSIAFPLLTYAIEVWYPPDSGQQRKLCRVQKYAARLLTNNFNRQTTYEDLLSSLNWKSFHRLVIERRLLSVYKYVHGTRYIDPHVFYLETVNETTRQSQRIRSSSRKHSLSLSTLSQKNQKESKLAAACMRSLWNVLPPNVVTAPVKKFVEMIKSEEIFAMLVDRGVVIILDGV